MRRKKSTIPTVKDVAREAGVAVGTVSKVINGKPVSEEYERRVREAIRKLDYHVNSYAQGLKATRTYTVAVLIPNTRNPFFGRLVTALAQSLSRRNYKVLLCCTDYNSRQEQEYVDMARMNKVDGIIGLTYNPDLQLSPDVPFVSIDRTFFPAVPCVSSDNFAGGQLAARKLAELGCHKVVFLRVGSTLDSEPNKRRSGFESGCIACGLEYDICNFGDGSDLEPLFRSYLSSHIRDGRFEYDGIFCVTDLLAVIIRHLLKEHGLRAGTDVQLIGFDGIRQFGMEDYVCSTIVQPIEAMAEAAVDLLLGDHPYTTPPLLCLPVTFHEGGTTRPF